MIAARFSLLADSGDSWIQGFVDSDFEDSRIQGVKDSGLAIRDQVISDSRDSIMETDRRTILRILGAAPAVAAFTWTDAEAQQAHTHAQTAQTTAQKTGTAYKPKFFNAHEWATIAMLADMIIPKDDRSGSATDAGVPEFIDFMMADQPTRQTAMRGGLA